MADVLFWFCNKTRRACGKSGLTSKGSSPQKDGVYPSEAARMAVAGDTPVVIDESNSSSQQAEVPVFCGSAAGMVAEKGPGLSGNSNNGTRGTGRSVSAIGKGWRGFVR